jgi:hypothetical protein
MRQINISIILLRLQYGTEIVSIFRALYLDASVYDSGLGYWTFRGFLRSSGIYSHSSGRKVTDVLGRPIVPYLKVEDLPSLKSRPSKMEAT